jgi:hypothetical protein
MRKHSVLFAIALVLLIIGCASSPQTPAPSPQPSAMTTPPPPTPSATAATADDGSKARVVIYRPKSIMGMALHPTVMLDGKDLINVGNGTVWVGMFPPGNYAFQMDDKKSGAELDLKAGESYYMKVEIVPGVWKGGGRMTLMAKEQGAPESRDLRPLPAKEVEHPMFKQ